MLIWTIQNRKTWFTEQFDKKNNCYFAIWDHDESYQNKNGESSAYDWLRKELPKRIENYSGYAPIWAYPEPINIREKFRTVWKKHKPDYIIVKARVSSDRVLQSCCYSWNFCLNNKPIIPYIEYEDKNSYISFKGDIKDTWDLVFKKKGRKSWLDKEKSKYKFQLCIDRLYSDEIVSIHRIIGRKRRKYE